MIDVCFSFKEGVLHTCGVLEYINLKVLKKSTLVVETKMDELVWEAFFKDPTVHFKYDVSSPTYIDVYQEVSPEDSEENLQLISRYNTLTYELEPV